MIGILVVLMISWALLHFIEKKNLLDLGLLPNKIRISHFFIGFIFLFLLNLCTVFMDTIVYSIEWKRNPDIEFVTVLQAFYFHLKSALTEELVFRGALLYILIQRLGAKKGIIISAIVFGVYHWFTYGMFGSIVPMIYVFIITASMGLVWAYSFAKTGSIFLAFGLHLGTNFLSAIFSRSPTGSLIWIESSRIDLPEWTNLFYLLAKGLIVPVLCFFFIQYLYNHGRNTST